jgi:DNA polymerase III subunit delta
MPIQTPDAVLKELKSKKYHPFYFLHGEESYYIDLISDFIEENCLTAGEKGFNQIIMYGKDTNVQNIVSQARRFPMMASRQVVIVKELQQMDDWNKSDSNQVLLNYLEKPVPSTVLVFNHKHKTLAKNTSLYKKIEAKATVIESKKIYESQVPNWIHQYIQTKNLKIEAKATQLLVEAIGADLGKLHNELDKLTLNIAENTPITEDLIEKYVGISKDYNVFELQNAFIHGNLYKAKQIADYWAANPKKQPLILTLSLLYGFFSKALIAYHQKDRSEQNLAKALKVSPYFVKDYLQLMKNYTLADMVQTISHLRKADMQIKGIEAGNSSEGEILKELMAKIILKTH